MDKRLTATLIVIVLIGVIVIIIANRAAINAVETRVLIENWEQFFRVVLADLGDEINTRNDNLQELRAMVESYGAQLTREKEQQIKYEGVLKEFSDKVKKSGSNELVAYSQTYSSEAAQNQLREFVGAVIDGRAKIMKLDESMVLMERQIQETEKGLRIARDQVDKLQKKGEQAVREKSLAELKTMTLEMGGDARGCSTNMPLAGVFKSVNDHLVKMREHMDALRLVPAINFRISSSDSRIVSIQHVLQHHDDPERKKKIDETLYEIMQK